MIARVYKWSIQRQSLWSLAANGISALSGLILFALTSSRLTAADFGIWILFQTGSGLLDMFRVGLLLPGFLQLSAGKHRKTKMEIFHSVQHIFILLTAAQIILCVILYLIVPVSSPWSFFFQYYPWITISGALMTVSEWWFQSNVRFQHIFFVRFVNRALMIVLVFFLAFDLKSLIYFQSVNNLFTCVIIIFFIPVPAFRYIKHKLHHRNLFHFGKYSTPTQLASNLLKSSDTLLISYALGSAATGLYGAAAKFLEFVELPIRSLGAVLFNNLAKLANANRHHDAIILAKKEILKTTLRIAPIAFFLGIFAPFIIEQISGDSYASSVPILRAMAIYCLFIPADRCCGLLLESFGHPDLNLLKVIVMLLFNLIGDVIAIYFYQSPLAVAYSSIITFSIGIGFGFWMVIFKAIPRQQNAKLKLATHQ
jgi:O-antigen/teichoic acid export membrane protein